MLFTCVWRPVGGAGLTENGLRRNEETRPGLACKQGIDLDRGAFRLLILDTAHGAVVTGDSVTAVHTQAATHQVASKR